MKVASANADGSDSDEFAFTRWDVDVFNGNGTLRGVHSEHGDTVLKL
jgi:hypothetical protein